MVISWFFSSFVGR